MPHALPAHEVARRLAAGLAGSPVLGGAVFARYGDRTPRVFLHSAGRPDDEEWEDLFPFLVVSPSREEAAPGSRTLSIEVLLCVRFEGEAGASKPVQSLDGVWEMPGADALQDAVSALVGAVREMPVGAILLDWSADWDFGSEWPEQSAVVTFNFENQFAF